MNNNPYHDADPITLLEELLSLTQQFLPIMDRQTRKTWQKISSSTADIRENLDDKNWNNNNHS